MIKSISLILMLLGASPIAVALDPVINKATAIELVHYALVSQGEVGAGTDVAIYPIPDYYARTLFLSRQKCRTRAKGGLE